MAERQAVTLQGNAIPHLKYSLAEQEMFIKGKGTLALQTLTGG